MDHPTQTESSASEESMLTRRRQAQPLPLLQLSVLPSTAEPMAKGGPMFPCRSTLLASWWLLREIEASAAELTHITVDTDFKVVHWRLPSSKADWQALGGHSYTFMQLSAGGISSGVSIPCNGGACDRYQTNQHQVVIPYWKVSNHPSQCGPTCSRGLRNCCHHYRVGSTKIHRTQRKRNGGRIPGPNSDRFMANTAVRTMGFRVL